MCRMIRWTILFAAIVSGNARGQDTAIVDESVYPAGHRQHHSGVAPLFRPRGVPCYPANPDCPPVSPSAPGSPTEPMTPPAVPPGAWDKRRAGRRQPAGATPPKHFRVLRGWVTGKLPPPRSQKSAEYITLTFPEFALSAISGRSPPALARKQ